jgi:muramoyltetrapeptide carboxypeptidase LdcA involved in peptidoglycan recycling
MDAEFLWSNPEIRAKDINDAFADREVKAIFTSIGRNDSIRILPFLDKEIIRNNPKILIGYSDTTAIHTFLNLNGVVSFYGPSVMAGLSQIEALPIEFKKHLESMLFNKQDNYEYKAYDKYCEGYPR